MRNQIHLFLTAIMFYTRIPCPSWVDHSPEYLNKATGYLPLVGWLVGGFSALVFWVSTSVFPITISLLLSMVSSIWITGAFHEDGLADVVDGIGGGWSRDQILDIMKDSRIGTYGAIGLMIVLVLKYLTLLQFREEFIPLVLIVGHSASRTAPLVLITSLDYARKDGSGKSSAVAESSLSLPVLIFSSIVGFISIFLLTDLKFFLVVPVVLLLSVVLKYYFERKIGGYTGDCLGAVQQIAEIVLYLLIFLIS